MVVAALGLHTLARHQGWLTDRMSPEALTEFLEPHFRIEKPDGEGPFPAALLFSGCDGPANNLPRWSAALVAAGYVTLVVDSHTPRDLIDYEAWRLVCAGQLLPAPERAGDVLVGMAYAAALPFVDADRLTLIGMSHGGWSIMDLMTRDLPREMPVNLRRLPAGLGTDPLAHVEALVLVYPWCGLASRARHYDWVGRAPILFLLARADTIAPSAECELVARALRAEGKSVEVEIFDGVTHGYDQDHASPLSPLRFDAEATAQSIDRALAFMKAAHEDR